MIEVKNLSKRFGKNKVLIDLNLDIRKPGIFAVLGPNGSGKTTLIKSILGMNIPDKGSISLNGEQIRKKWKYREEIQYLPQIATFPGNLRLIELIRMIKDMRSSESQEEELIELFSLKPFLRKQLSTLSGGTKQKVNVVLAFMIDAPIVILDEPTTGLDPQAMIHLRGLIRKAKEEGKTILITSHIMQFVEEVADEIIYLLEGKIYFKGSLSELREKSGQDDLEHAIASITSVKSYA
ncbi:ABC transporter ATP-binding protein [Cryomorphaceae bacterium 1068]|nr:ABC transporter ATP-binding protein [Cryomorphaceae bacterium 1068]